MSWPCVFCDIVARKEPATIRYEDDEVIAFDNRLRWVPVMLLVMRKAHLSQPETWANLGKVGEVAVKLGEQHCPNGFRILANFGRDAMQSQYHGHLHVIGGTYLGPYA